MSDAPGPWSADGLAARVAVSEGPDPFAYRPGELIVAGERAVEAAGRVFGERLRRSEPEPLFPPTDTAGGEELFVLRAEADADVVEAVDVLAGHGVTAQPNHVLFAHSCCCGPHPAQRWAAALTGAPLFAAPLFAAPLFAAPLFAAPLFAAGVGSVLATGRPLSTAKPVPGPATVPAGGSTASTGGVRVAVLDTGMAADGVRPAALDAFVPDPAHWEVPDDDRDRRVDPAAGHGTFIAGLIDLLTPGCQLTVERVLTNDGDGDEVAVARRIDALAGSVDILNLSFGGYAMSHALGLAAAVRHVQAAGAVVVASAGNDGTCRRTYPAALRGVVGVGAVGPNGPAPFSNYGPWVRACAPGVDVVSRFFTKMAAGAADPGGLTGWAQWSGTSFAAPAVAAALAAEMARRGVSAREAVRRVVDAPGLLRIPDLGTVVNAA